MIRKILFTIPNFDTAGSGKALLNIAKGLDKERFEPHIMCMHDRGAFFEVVKSSGIPVHIYQYTSEMKPYLKGIKNCWKVSRVFKQIAPDIIHSFHYSADYSEALAAKMAGIKWVYTKKNMNWGGASANSWKLRTWLANGIAVQNTDMLRVFFQNTTKTFLIPRGVNTLEFAFDHGLPDLRSVYGIPSNEKLIITVANLVPVKGLEVLLEAYKCIYNEIPRWSLIIVGDDSNAYAQSLKDLCKRLNICNKVHFTGKIPDVKELLQLAEIFVLPTLDEGRREGSPVSLLEAMANSRFVLGSAVPGIKDQLADFPDHLFQAGNVSELARKLHNSVIMSDSQRMEKGVAFSRHVITHYPIEKEIQLHEAMYVSMR